MNLIIVESPTKANTIQKFLKGGDFIVRSSYGHIRDLPKSEIGINIEKNFEPKYIIPLKARKKVSELKKYFKKADKIILATDEDREGEAIAFHIAKILGIENPKRIVFHEITKQAIDEALKNSRKIDIDMVNAQQARRILDRLVGYNLSPFLWKKVMRRLSAGRVQSAAVKLICEKEKEIKEFKPDEYWTIVASLLKIKNQKSKIKNNEFEATLYKKDGKIILKLGIENKKEADKILEDLNGAEYKVSKIQKKERTQNPLPPFTTSLLQQEAWQKFHFSAKYTMRIAQSLYEKGLCTYHRTDSFNLSDQSLFGAEKVIKKKFGENYWAGYFRKYKTKSKSAQEAHEAIRPTNPEKTIEEIENKLKQEEQKLYDLIWRRFIACQMAQARIDSTTAEIETASNYTFRADGQIIKFDGFLKVYPLLIKENILPEIKENEILELQKLIPSQHFTKPPARYSEATLVKVLEKYGIGRPSTYAPIISTIQTRNYIEKDEKRRLKPTEIGNIVNDILCEHFSDIVDVNFTAKMEKDLDEIADGKIEWQKLVGDFYFPFEKNLKKKEKEVPKKEIAEKKTGEKCPKCEKPLIVKYGRFGKFCACSGFPECKFTKPYLDSTKIPCPKCEKGEVVKLKTKKGRLFYGCSKYPKCDYMSWQKPKT